VLILTPDAVRTILVTTAGAMMTVVVTLFSILLVVQTLASEQFSPRIIGSLLRDRTSQLTLGFTIGSVLYFFIVLLAVRDQPPFVPSLGLGSAALLFVVGLGVLMNYIHHVSKIIQINYVVDRIAQQTEAALDFAFPVVLAPGTWPETPAPPAPEAPAVIVESSTSGYIQGIDLDWLQRVAKRHGVQVQSLLRIGDFATTSVALATVSPPPTRPNRVAQLVRDGYFIGPVRTIGQDPDFGFRQLVDVALKAISPAVNDPTTAVTCLRHLGRLLVYAAVRHNPYIARPEQGPHPRVVLRPQVFTMLLDHAVTQLRQYGRSDFAVTLSLLNVLRDLARETTYPPYLERISLHADLVHEGRDLTRFTGPDLTYIEQAYAEVVLAVERQRAAQVPSVSADAPAPLTSG
jgi:uncharacterized membrane protein